MSKLLESAESEPLLATPGPSNENAGYVYSEDEEQIKNEAAMAELGVSRNQLVGTPVEGGRKLPQYIAALAATLGAFAAGSMLGWSSPVLFRLGQANSTDYNFTVTEDNESWISSLINLGAALICFPIGLIMDAIGRKKTMLILVLPFTLGWSLIIWAANVGMLMAGRFITGIAGGAFCVTAPAYTSEIAQDSIRGTLGSYFQLMITIGILFAYVAGNYISVFAFNFLCGLIPIIFGVIFFFMPESPKYLAMKGKNEEARKSLVWLRGTEYDVDSELNNLKRQQEEAQVNQTSFRSSITKRNVVKAIVICYFLMVFQQLSGINAVIFNTSTIFSSAGASFSEAISSIIIGVIQVIATFVSSLVVDKVGRRILLLLSALIMCVCSLALGVYFYLKDGGSEAVDSLSWLPLLSLSLFIVAFSIGFGPIPWMMAGELCLINIKAFVASTAGTLNWLLSFAVTSAFGALRVSIGMGQVFWIFSSIMVLAFLFIFFIVPETKGKSVDEIQLLLGARSATPVREEKN